MLGWTGNACCHGYRVRGGGFVPKSHPDSNLWGSSETFPGVEGSHGRELGSAVYKES